MECINILLALEQLCLMCQSSASQDNSIVNNNNQSQQQQQQQAQQQVLSSATSNVNNLVMGNKTSKRPTYAEIAENPLKEDRIRVMQFDFDALSVLAKCQQAELLFSMFADGWFFYFSKLNYSINF